MASNPQDGGGGELTHPGQVFKTIGGLPGNDLEPSIPPSLLASLDAILVLGGGVPASYDEPPVYVQLRCDMAARVFHLSQKASSSLNRRPPSILTLSAGTAHMPQLLSEDGLPIWESTASAAYLLEKHSDIPDSYVLAETTSYDTISNAYFSRTSFADVVGWRKLLIVTNEFHMDRTKAIFDWIFHAKRETTTEPLRPYELYYLSCDNVGLTADALRARKEHEGRGANTVSTKLSKQHPTLVDVYTFLTQNHDFYSARKLSDRAKLKLPEERRNEALKDSYGAAQRRPPANEGKSPSSRDLRELWNFDQLFSRNDFASSTFSGAVVAAAFALLMFYAGRNSVTTTSVGKKEHSK